MEKYKEITEKVKNSLFVPQDIVMNGKSYIIEFIGKKFDKATKDGYYDVYLDFFEAENEHTYCLVGTRKETEKERQKRINKQKRIVALKKEAEKFGFKVVEKEFANE